MIDIIIMSAGFGSRLDKDIPKGMYPLNNKPLIEYSIDTLMNIKDSNINVVLGYKAECFSNTLKKYPVSVFYQDKLNGTSNAIKACEGKINGELSLIIPVDTPLVSLNTYNEFIKFHKDNLNDLSILTYEKENPTFFGRIIRVNDEIVSVKEEEELLDKEREIKEVNSSIYLVNNDVLFGLINEVNNNNKRGEYNLVDIVKIGVNKGLKIGSFKVKNTRELLSINDKNMLKDVENELKNRSKN